MTNDTSTRNPTSVPIADLIAERWSPRAYDPTHAVSREDLVALFEAARWGASGGNQQPWQYIAAARGTAAFDSIKDALAPWNPWADAASALVAVFVTTADGEGGTLSPADQRAKFYDAGLSVANIALEAANRGLQIHQTAGTDADKLRAAFDLGADLELVTAFSVGAVTTSDDAPAQFRESDAAPRSRRALEEIVDIHV